MARNGAGQYSRVQASYVFNTIIDQVSVNSELDDISTALTNSLTKNGETTATANQPMGTFRHTGVGNGVARTDYPSMGQLEDGTVNWVAGGGTADAITATYAPVLTALVDGQLCFVRATAANATATPTFAPNGLTARIITLNGGQALVAGNIFGAGHELILRYKLATTVWELLNPNVISITGNAATATTATTTTTATNQSGGSVNATTGAFSGLLTLTGGQIKFPATAVPSADANTLDDYEEGTWTPSVGGTATYITQSGTYTKIGRVVFFRGTMTINVIGTGNTTVISGIPFTSVDQQSVAVNISIAATNIVSAMGIIGSGATTMSIESRTVASASPAANAIFTTGTSILMSGSFTI